MKDIDKVLLFLTIALIYSSVIYLLGQKQETELELDISNSLLNDMIYPKYADGTYKSDWVWTTYTDGRAPEYKPIPECKIGWNNSCVQHTVLSNQSLNGTTHVRLKAPVNIVDIVLAYIEYQNK